MNTTENRKRWNLRRWLVPASLAAAMVVLPGAVSTAEAGSPHKYILKAHKRVRGHIYEAAKYVHGNIGPGHVSHHRPRGHGHVSHHRPRGHGHVSYHRPRGHGHVSYHRSYGHGHFSPVHVSYYRPRVHRPASFYLETPYVVVHGPRIDARVVYYPGDVALHQPGYCPSELHYHPYENDHRADVDVHARINVQLNF